MPFSLHGLDALVFRSATFGIPTHRAPDSLNNGDDRFVPADRAEFRLTRRFRVPDFRLASRLLKIGRPSVKHVRVGHTTRIFGIATGAAVVAYDDTGFGRFQDQGCEARAGISTWRDRRSRAQGGRARSKRRN